MIHVKIWHCSDKSSQASSAKHSFALEYPTPGTRSDTRRAQPTLAALTAAPDQARETLAPRRPDVSRLGDAYQNAIAQVEKKGWSEMKWDSGYSLLHWAAKKDHADLITSPRASRAELKPNGRASIQKTQHEPGYDLVGAPNVFSQLRKLSTNLDMTW